jgi:alginate O-acetyltransferase complex protein AlgJ
MSHDPDTLLPGKMTLFQALAALTLVAVTFAGAWQTVISFSHLDETKMPRSTQDFWEGRTLSTLEKQWDSQLPLRKSAIALANGLRYRLTGGGGEQVRVGSNGWLFLTDELHYFAEGHASLQTRVRWLHSVATRLEQAGVRLVVAVVPDKARMYAGHAKGDLEYPVYNADRYREFLTSLQERNIPVVDLEAALQQTAPRLDLYYLTDTHWNQAGAQLAAQAIALEIQKLHVAIAKTEFRTTLATTTQPRTGDLVRLMGLQDAPTFLRPLDDWEAPATTEQASADSSESLLGDASVPIVLTGTSYSLRGNFHGYLQQALGAKILNAAKDGSGFIQATAEYLANESFRTSKPQVLVWEIPERFLYTTTESDAQWIEKISTLF